MTDEMKKKRILLVEDEESLIEMISFNLEMEGYDVTPAMDGKVALDIA
ncbi:MAG: two-component system alkaline phosphatase synthesis response regulator PhoP, partial [Flammeovirgaceae bacterium]